MAKSDVTPTRRNYLDIQKRLARTQEGYELLEQKRQILIMELMTLVEAARRLKREIAETMAEAFDALKQAALRVGMTSLLRQSAGIRMDHNIGYRPRSVMGVEVPELSCQPAEFGVEFSLSEGQSRADEVMKRFQEALPLVAELARVENAVFRLAREVRRTQRRVNALEKLYIPEYKETLRFIEDALAERQREEFIVLRKVKNKHRAEARRKLEALQTRPQPLSAEAR
jgi:V/A-type H+-transporting ATPase subunit D